MHVEHRSQVPASFTMHVDLPKVARRGNYKQVDLLGSQVAAWDLGEDVAVKDAGKDEAS
jgi:hypothetical protein